MRFPWQGTDAAADKDSECWALLPLISSFSLWSNTACSCFLPAAGGVSGVRLHGYMTKRCRVLIHLILWAVISPSVLLVFTHCPTVFPPCGSMTDEILPHISFVRSLCLSTRVQPRCESGAAQAVSVLGLMSASVWLEIMNFPGWHIMCNLSKS